MTITIEKKHLNANGGSFGTQTNLMGDASSRLGKKIANFINKECAG